MKRFTINPKRIMKIKVVLLALVLVGSTCLITAQDANQRPDGQTPPASGGAPGDSGGPGGQEGGPRGARGGFHLLPPRAQEKLKLTADQQKQIASLETEVKAKLEKILTAEQMQQLKQMRPPRPQGGSDGGQNGPDGGQGGSEDRPQHPPNQ
jgi:hypothetical protein